jgi:hypothetical protein
LARFIFGPQGSSSEGNFLLGVDQDSFNGGFNSNQRLDGQMDDLIIF